MAMKDPALAFLVVRALQLLRALLHLVVFALADHFLPTWLTTCLIIGDCALRLGQFDIISHLLDGYPVSRLAIYLVMIGGSVGWVVFTASYFRLVLYNGFFNHLLGASIARLMYVLNDGPPNQTSQDWLFKRDSAIVYGISTYVLAHPRTVLANLSWTNIRCYILIPLGCYAIPLMLLRRYMKRKDLLYLVISWPLSAVADVMTSSLDIYSLGVAILVYYIPNKVDRILSQCYQKIRSIQSAPSYIYDPLGSMEIRLLVLERRLWMFQGAVRANIIHCRLDRAPDYEAVSYHWGSDERTDEILICNRGTAIRFPVTRSAFDLLVARRSIWRKRTIWIDAICINQADDIEKAEQVQSMCDIYQRASRVIVFPSSDWYARAAIPVLQQLQGFVQMTDDPMRSHNKLAIGERYSRNWRTIVGLLNNEYFNRIWVAQEIVVGRNVQLYYGGHYIPWSAYYSIVQQLLDQPSRDLMATGLKANVQTWYNSSTFENVSAFSALRRNSPHDIRHEGRLGLETVLLCTSKFKATNPRDQIFAILGICDHAESDLLKVDYGKSAEQILEDATRYLLLDQAQPTTDILCLAGTGFSPNRLSVPSWVVERSEDRGCIQYTDVRQHENTFRASGDRLASILVGKIPGTIQVQGVLLKDTIRSMSSAGVFDLDNIRPGMQTTSAEIVRWKYRFMLAAEDLVEEYSGRPGDLEVQKDGLWLALIAGRIDRKLDVDPRYRLVHKFCFRMLELMAQSKDGITFDAKDADFNTIADEFKPADWVEYLPQRYLASFMEACFGRCFAMTQTGRLCLVPPLTQAGDMIFIPFGAQTPCVVRRKGSNHLCDSYELIGETYVHGIMMGEGIESGADELFIMLM